MRHVDESEEPGTTSGFVAGPVGGREDCWMSGLGREAQLDA